MAQMLMNIQARASMLYISYAFPSTDADCVVPASGATGEYGDKTFSLTRVGNDDLTGYAFLGIAKAQTVGTNTCPIRGYGVNSWDGFNSAWMTVKNTANAQTSVTKSGEALVAAFLKII